MTDRNPVGLKDFPGSSAEHTEVVFILDASGSMDAIRQEAVDHFNECVDTLSSVMEGVGTSSVSLVTFNEKVTPAFWCRPLDTMTRLTVNQYIPSGMTAMNDAIGTAINEVERRNSSRTGNISYLFNIITDGRNNVRIEFDGEQISKMIKDRQNRGNWTFTFAGANIDVEELGRRMNVPTANVAQFCADSAGVYNLSSRTSEAISRYAVARGGGAMSASSFYDDDEAPKTTDRTQ